MNATPADDIVGRLLSLLRTRSSQPTLRYLRTPIRLTGGFWAELIAFELFNPPPGLEGPLVARVMPDASLARKEIAVQTAVAAAGVPTPHVRMAGDPGDGLGRAFMVMDRANGSALLAGLESAAGSLALHVDYGVHRSSSPPRWHDCTASIPSRSSVPWERSTA